LTTTRRSAANRLLRLNAVRPCPNAERPPRTTPPSGRRTWFDTCLPPDAQNLVDEALVAASIADGPHQDLEFIVVAAHGLSGIAVWLVPKRALRNRAFCFRVALPTDRRPAESQAMSMAWRRAGASLLSCHLKLGDLAFVCWPRGALIGPAPGMRMKRRHRSSWRTIASTTSCSRTYLCYNALRARSMQSMREAIS
jgi:hypothetical protein